MRYFHLENQDKPLTSPLVLLIICMGFLLLSYVPGIIKRFFTLNNVVLFSTLGFYLNFVFESEPDIVDIVSNNIVEISNASSDCLCSLIDGLIFIVPLLLFALLSLIVIVKYHKFLVIALLLLTLINIDIEQSNTIIFDNNSPNKTFNDVSVPALIFKDVNWESWNELNCLLVNRGSGQMVTDDTF